MRALSALGAEKAAANKARCRELLEPILAALDGEEEFPAGTTDGLADIYDEWLTENFPEALWPGHRLSADELLHEVFALMEKATEDEKPAWQEKANWLDRFLEKWEKVQQAGDFAASNARGE